MDSNVARLDERCTQNANQLDRQENWTMGWQTLFCNLPVIPNENYKKLCDRIIELVNVHIMPSQRKLKMEDISACHRNSVVSATNPKPDVLIHWQKLSDAKYILRNRGKLGKLHREQRARNEDLLIIKEHFTKPKQRKVSYLRNLMMHLINQKIFEKGTKANANKRIMLSTKGDEPKLICAGKPISVYEIPDEFLADFKLGKYVPGEYEQ